VSVCAVLVTDENAGRWLALRLDLLSALIIYSVAIVGIIIKDHINPSEYGLVFQRSLPRYFHSCDIDLSDRSLVRRSS
jgi:hypothetical protein